MVVSNILCPKCMHSKESETEPCPKCGFDLAGYVPLPNSLPFFSILKGRYLVGKPLGVGGFGITYIALDLQVGAVCAIKEYMPELAAARFEASPAITLNEQKRELFDYGKKRFMEEAGLLVSFLSVPNIIHVFDCFEENGTAYYVMEYLDGCDLKSLTQDRMGKLDEAAGLPIMLQVMNGLEALHQRGVIHRDISPDNIYVTIDNRVKILDFGSARYSFSQRNKNLSVIIKVGYAPPEQYGSAVEQGPWTDIYALGATFYHVFTGVIPPESTERLLQDNLVPVTSYNPSVSPTLEAVLMKALSLKTPGRFQSISEMRECLLNSSKRQAAVLTPVHSVKQALSTPRPPVQAKSKFSCASTGLKPEIFLKKRGCAYLIDMLLYFFAIGLFVGLVRYTVAQQGMLSEVSTPVVTFALFLFPVLIVLINALLESSKRGATIGKLVTGLKISDKNIGQLSFVKAMLRNVLKLLSVFLLLTYKERTFLHDRIAGTQVTLTE